MSLTDIPMPRRPPATHRLVDCPYCGEPLTGRDLEEMLPAGLSDVDGCCPFCLKTLEVYRLGTTIHVQRPSGVRPVFRLEGVAAYRNDLNAASLAASLAVAHGEGLARSLAKAWPGGSTAALGLAVLDVVALAKASLGLPSADVAVSLRLSEAVTRVEELLKGGAHG